jgi:hypothetical protein
MRPFENHERAINHLEGGAEGTPTPQIDSTMKIESSRAIPHEVEISSCRAQSPSGLLKMLPEKARLSSDRPEHQIDQASQFSGTQPPTNEQTAERAVDDGPGTEADLNELMNLDEDPLTDPGAGPSPEWLEALSRIRPRELVAPDPQRQAEAVKETLSEIEREPAEPSPEMVKETEEAIRNLSLHIPDASRFVAGSFQAYLPAWQELLANSKRASSKKVLSWLKYGFTPKLVGTNHAPEKNKIAVQAMLRRVMTQQEADQFLAGKFPGRVEFKNHKSFYVHWDFSSKEVANLATVGAASILPLGAEKRVLVHPFGVALTAGKRRLICDARGLNMFLQNFPFQYEKLRDVLAYTKKGYFMVTWDLNSGYYQIPIHPAYRKFFGFRIGNRYGVYNEICFGLSEACYAFTKVAQKPLIELRARGFPVSGYIDDGHTAARTYGRTLWQGYLIIRLLAALGAFFGLPKCNLEPLQELRWLGFLLDTLKETFKVAQSNLDSIKELLQEVIAQPSVSNRELASLAGKLVALSPAVLPALLFSRSIFQAMTGHKSWDVHFPNPEAVRKEACHWLENIDMWNGRAWWPQPHKLTLNIDASALGYGGFIQHEGKERLQVAGTFSPKEGAASSAARECIGYVRAIETASKIFADRLNNSAVLLIGDSQAALAALRKFASPVPIMHRELKRLFNICSNQHFDIIPRWVSRENLSEADELSRRPDASDWGLSSQLVTAIERHFQVSIDVDMFASDVNHVVPRFASAFHVPGSLAVHALRQDWLHLLSHRSAIVWAFPPTKLVSKTLSLLERQQVNAVFILPSKPTSNDWIQVLNVTRNVSRPYLLPRVADLCRPSLRVPVEAINPILMGLAAFHIQWNPR